MASKDTTLAFVLAKKRFPNAFPGEPAVTTSIANQLNENKLASVLVAGDYPASGVS